MVSLKVEPQWVANRESWYYVWAANKGIVPKDVLYEVAKSNLEEIRFQELSEGDMDDNWGDRD